MIRSCLSLTTNICLRPKIIVSRAQTLRRISMTMASNVDQSQPTSGPNAAPQSRPQAAKKPGKKEIKILMLHGFTQSGPLFHAKTRALEKLMTKSLAPFGLQPTLIFPTGPNRLLPSDIPGFDPTSASADEDPRSADSWAWFRRDEATGTYRLLREGMRRLATAMRDAGGVDGVVGFSQGGAMAGMLAAALEEPRRDVGEAGGDWVEELREANAGRPLAFAVIYSGFVATPTGLAWMYEPRIRTPTLHFIGSLDTVVDETRTRGMVAKCEDPVVVEHPGGHYVPVSKEWAMPLIGFIKQKCVDDVAAVQGKI